MKLKELIDVIKVKESDKLLEADMNKLADKEKLKGFVTELKGKVRKNADVFIPEGEFYFKVNEENQFIDGDKILDIHAGSHIVITPYAYGAYHDKFLNEISKAGAYLYKLDWYGNPLWGLYPLEKAFANIIRAQVLFLEQKNDDIRGKMIQELIERKMLSHQDLIPFINVPIKKKNESIQTYINKVMGIEGIFASKVWIKYRDLNDLDKVFKVRSTEIHEGKKSNVNATNIISALLNLGYGILAHKITFELYEAGLEPSLGFYHSISSKGRRYNLTWDIIEPYRANIDRIIIDNLNEINIEDWIWEQPNETRFLMLKEQPHEIGIPSKSEYKKWIKIFTDNLPKLLLQDKNSILMIYKNHLKETLRRAGITKQEELERAIGATKE